MEMQSALQTLALWFHYLPERQAAGILGPVLQMQKLRLRNKSMNHNSSRASQRNNQVVSGFITCLN